MDKEKQIILNDLNKLWFQSSCSFRTELLNVISKIEKKDVKKNCDICNKFFK